MATPYREFAETVQRLTAAVEDLEHSSGLLHLDPLSGREWYDLLRQKLLPQLHDDAFLVAAVCGGTNIGKSVIFNHLAGTRASATSPLASGTKHPTVLLHPDFAGQHDLRAIFEGMHLAERTDPDAALRESPEHMLFWVTSDRIPRNLLVLDTPDIDSDAQVNWQRADQIRRSADVLIGVLTQQKYNDAAVKQFFRKAAQEDKAVVVVFNQCELPDDEAYWPLWLDTFCRETGIDPEIVYVAPRNRAAADRGELPFYERPWPVTVEQNRAAHADDPGPPRRLADDLSRFRFADVKLRTLRGSIQMLLRADVGVPAYLREVEASSGRFQSAVNALGRDELVQNVLWPSPPSALLAAEIRRWWQAQREGWSANIHGFYNNIVGPIVSWPVRTAYTKIVGETKPPLTVYREEEWKIILNTVEEIFERLSVLSQAGNRLLSERLQGVLGGSSRAELLKKLEAAHAEVDLERDLREMVSSEMRLFKSENPGAHKILRRLDNVAAVVRPAISIGIFWVIPGGDVAAHALTEGALNAMLHGLGEAAGAAGSDVAVAKAAGGVAGLVEAKLRRMKSAFIRERVAWLLAQLNEHLWGNLLEDLYGGAAVAQSDPFRRVQRELDRLAQQLAAEPTRSVA